MYLNLFLKSFIYIESTTLPIGLEMFLMNVSGARADSYTVHQMILLHKVWLPDRREVAFFECLRVLGSDRCPSVCFSRGC